MSAENSEVASGADAGGGSTFRRLLAQSRAAQGHAAQEVPALAGLEAEVRSLRTQLAAHRPEKQVLSMRQAAKLLGIDRNRTLKALLATGQLRAIQVNKALKVSRAEVERLTREGFSLTEAPMRKTRGRKPKASAIPAEKSIRAIKL